MSFGVLMTDFYLSVFFGLISLVGFALANVMSKSPVEKIGSAGLVFLRGIFISLFLLAAFLFFPANKIPAEFFAIILGISILGYVTLALFFESLKADKAGIVIPITRASVLVTVALSIIFFGESLSLLQIFAVVLIVLGAILASVDLKLIKKTGLKFSRGVVLAFVVCFLWGIYFFFFKIPVQLAGPVMASFASEILLMVFGGTQLVVLRKNLEIDLKTVLLVGAIGFLSFMGVLFFNLGIGVGSVSIVAAIGSAAPIIAVVYGKLVYKEVYSRQQLLGVVLMVLGLIAIVI
jgi:drug/metabolite transporter (DMT)-like permease